jgi:hypothetical protein
VINFHRLAAPAIEVALIRAVETEVDVDALPARLAVVVSLNSISPSIPEPGMFRRRKIWFASPAVAIPMAINATRDRFENKSFAWNVYSRAWKRTRRRKLAAKFFGVPLTNFDSFLRAC